MGIGDHSVEGEREDFGRTTGGGRDGEMVGGVVEEFWVEHRDVGDRLAVGRPCGGHVDAGVRGDLGEMSTFVCVVCGDGPDVGVVGRVGIGRGVCCQGTRRVRSRRNRQR